MTNPVNTKIVAKFQVTVPPRIRDVFGLREGDLLQWSFDEQTSEIRVIPHRAQLVTPKVRAVVDESRARIEREETATATPRLDPMGSSLV